MTRCVFITAIFALLAVLAPASAQYRFDPTVKFETCSWREVCDLGGRAIRSRVIRWRHCPIVEQEHHLPDGRIVIERRRQCGSVLRVRG